MGIGEEAEFLFVSVVLEELVEQHLQRPDMKLKIQDWWKCNYRSRKMYSLKLSISTGLLKPSEWMRLARKESSQNLDVFHIYLDKESWTKRLDWGVTKKIKGQQERRRGVSKEEDWEWASGSGNWHHQCLLREQD